MEQPESPPGTFSRIGMVARWQPVHRGHAAILRALCSHAQTVLIGIGSADRHNVRSPFSAEDITAMLRLVLPRQTDVQIFPIRDLNDGPRWRLLILDLFGPLDAFVTDNPYVASLMKADYRLLRPVDLVPEAERIPIDGTMVRREMARGGHWQELVPAEVTEYIRAHGLDEQFRRDFGLQTLALDTLTN